jgi:post-segregation antitoxin (ccd killing protein)
MKLPKNKKKLETVVVSARVELDDVSLLRDHDIDIGAIIKRAIGRAAYFKRNQLGKL